MIEYKVLFSIILILVGGLTLFLIHRALVAIRERQISNLEKRKTVSAIMTESPVDQPKATFKEEGAENIRKRFSIIRNSVTVLLATVILVGASIPLLNMVPATILSVLAGSFAIIVGIISKPFIENYISGVIIGLNRTFKVGDTVLVEEQYGVIEDISMTNTVIRLWDWRRLIIPNAGMINKEVISYTFHDPFVWAKVEFWVSYDTDLQTLKHEAIEIAKKSTYFQKVEPPSFWVMEMAQKGYRCWLAVWTTSPSDAWELGNEVRSGLIIKFQELGIRSHSFNMVLDRDSNSKKFEMV